MIGFCVDKVWIVRHDEDPDNILGVFDVESEAYEYLDEVAVRYENGAYLAPFSVPYRSTDWDAQISPS